MINSTNNKHKAFAVKKAAALATAALLLAAALVFTGCKQTVDSPAGAGGGSTGPGGGTAPGERIIDISAYAIGWYNPSDNEYVDSIKFKTKAGQSWAQLKAEAETKIQAELGESTVYELAGEWYRDESKWDGGTLLTDDFVFTQSIDIYPVVKRKDITVTVVFYNGYGNAMERRAKTRGGKKNNRTFRPPYCLGKRRRHRHNRQYPDNKQLYYPCTFRPRHVGQLYY